MIFSKKENIKATGDGVVTLYRFGGRPGLIDRRKYYKNSMTSYEMSCVLYVYLGFLSFLQVIWDSKSWTRSPAAEVIE